MILQITLMKRRKAPIHLHGNNEENLIKIFKSIKKEDWIFSSWRSHYHCLLKGVPKEKLKKIFFKWEKHISLIYPEYNIYTSAIVGGSIPIALGTALSFKLQKKNQHVFLFMGKMTAETWRCS